MQLSFSWVQSLTLLISRLSLRAKGRYWVGFKSGYIKYFKLSVFVTVCGIIATISTIVYGLDEKLRSDVPTLALLVLAIFLLSWQYFSRLLLARRKAYCEALAGLHTISSSVAELSRVIEKEYADESAQRELITRHLIGIMDRVSEIFTNITGSRCRATLKAIGGSPDTRKASTHTLAREEASYQLCREDDEIRSRLRFDEVSRNIHLIQLILSQGPHKAYFIRQDLPTAYYCNDYFSTSIDWHYNEMDEDAIPEKHGKPEYPLAYRSTIVWVIRGQTDMDDERMIPLAFLAIDSPKTCMFIDDWDVELGAMVAAQLGPFMQTYWRQLFGHPA